VTVVITDATWAQWFSVLIQLQCVAGRCPESQIAPFLRTNQGHNLFCVNVLCLCNTPWFFSQFYICISKIFTLFCLYSNTELHLYPVVRFSLHSTWLHGATSHKNLNFSLRSVLLLCGSWFIPESEIVWFFFDGDLICCMLKWQVQL
jgi:hypothetical protein